MSLLCEVVPARVAWVVGDSTVRVVFVLARSSDVASGAGLPGKLFADPASYKSKCQAQFTLNRVQDWSQLPKRVPVGAGPTVNTRKNTVMVRSASRHHLNASRIFSYADESVGRNDVSQICLQTLLQQMLEEFAKRAGSVDRMPEKI